MRDDGGGSQERLFGDTREDRLPNCVSDTWLTKSFYLIYYYPPLLPVIIIFIISYLTLP